MITRMDSITYHPDTLAEVAQEAQRERTQVEELLMPALIQFQKYKQFPNENTVNDILHSMIHINYFKTTCPEGMTLQNFIRQASPFLRYEQYTRGKTIFHIGDTADKFFIVLKGIVGVYVPKSQQQIEKEIQILREAHQNSENKFQRQGTRKFSQAGMASSITHLTQGERDYIRHWFGKKDQQQIESESILIINEKRSNYFYTDNPAIAKFHKVFEYHAGENFGELALTTDQARAASIICTTDQVHLLSMTKSDFKKLSEKQIMMMTAKIDYYMQHFEGISKQTVIKFTNYFHDHVFNTSSELWREGDQPTFFFLIKRGRCELYRNVAEDTCDKGEVAHPQIRKTQRQKKLVLSTLSDNSFIGMEDVIENRKQRTYSCKVTEVTEAYYMSAEDFNGIRKMYPDIVKCLREKYQMITKYMSQRQVNILENQKQVMDRLNNLTLPKETTLERITAEKMMVKKFEKCLTEARFSNENETFIRSYQPQQLTKAEIADKNEYLHQILMKRSEQTLGTEAVQQFRIVPKEQLDLIAQRIERKFSSQRGSSVKNKNTSQYTHSDVFVKNLLKQRDKREGQDLNFKNSVNELYVHFGNHHHDLQRDSISSTTTGKKGSIATASRMNPILLSRAQNPKHQDKTKLLQSLHQQPRGQFLRLFKDSSQIFQTEVQRLHSAAPTNHRPKLRKGLSIQNYLQVDPPNSKGYLSGSRSRKSVSEQRQFLVSPTKGQQTTTESTKRQLVTSNSKGLNQLSDNYLSN